MTTITTTELREGLDDPRRTVVDIRPLAAYNGWRRERRGPRRPRPRRRRLPDRLARFGRRGRDRAPARLEGRSPPGATSSSTATAPPRPPTFVTELATLGIEGARIYEGGAAEWAADPIAAARPAAELRQAGRHRRGSARSSTGAGRRRRPTGKFLLFHVNFGVPEEYAEGHIPGALFLDTNWLEDPVDWNRRSPAVITRRWRASASPATRRSSCTAATPKVTPTRSGRAGAPARSPRRGR